MKKTKQPGDNFSLKTKKNEDPAVMSWINTQTNLMDSVRYLIENEISRNGIRNLQAHIPTERGPVSQMAGVALQELGQGRQELAAASAAAVPLSAPAAAVEREHAGDARKSEFERAVPVQTAGHTSRSTEASSERDAADSKQANVSGPQAASGRTQSSAEQNEKYAAEPPVPAEDDIDEDDIESWI
ncbi:hypothetical protein [Paenibacillus gansuensis]|uniref:Uncharacterized protein n=1 Tax=Paenibacillus gansuensis TaxID=306542 RepID=A0ABW5PJC8_9BACL